MQLTINMPDTITWASRDVDFTLDLTMVPEVALADLVAKAAEMGFRKAGVDAAASAAKHAKDNGLTIEEATTELTEKKIAVWLGGTWGAERSGDGMSRIERTAVSAVREAVKARDAKAYKSWDETERFAACVEYFEALSDEQKSGLVKWATAEIARRDAAKAAQADIFKDIGISL